MKRRFLTVTLTLAVALCLAQGTSKNLIKNGTLEDALSADGLPDGWSRFAQPEGGYKFGVVSGGRSGAKALQIEGAGDFGGVVSTRNNLDRGQRYAARGWMKVEGDANATATVKLDYYAADGKFLGSAVAGFVTPAMKDWQIIAVTDRQSEYPEAKFVATVVALTGKGKALFDDLEMVSAAAPPPGNLLTNGSMESVVADKVAHYYVGTSEGGKVTARWSADNPKDGWYCLNLKGNSEWAVAVHERVKFEKGKRYTLTGWARARNGTAQIKFDYFEGDKYLGMTGSDDVNSSEWQQRTVFAQPSEFPNATHISATAVGLGEMDCYFDGLVLMAK